jgi:hypothetical protein
MVDAVPTVVRMSDAAIDAAACCVQDRESKAPEKSGDVRWYGAK